MELAARVADAAGFNARDFFGNQLFYGTLVAYGLSGELILSR